MFQKDSKGSLPVNPPIYFRLLSLGDDLISASQL